MIKRLKIPEKFSFRTRLFAVMIGMLIIAGIMILGTTSIQYESQRENYQKMSHRGYKTYYRHQNPLV